MSTKYLVLHMTEPTGTDLAPEDDQRLLGRWAATGTAEDRLRDGGPVAAAEQARSVTVRGGRPVVTSGPFPEFTEWFLGYDVVTADSIDEAAEFMAGHPTAVRGRVLVLPLVPLPWEE